MNPKDGYIAYIANPKAGSSGAKPLPVQFRQYLESKGFEVRYKPTVSLEHACELATEAAVDFSCALVAAAGGDGTIREVAHGLEGSDKPMLVVPCGTENLLANELGFDEKVSTTIKTFEEGCTHELDLGSANGKCFTSIAGFGFDGEIVKRVHGRRTGHIVHMDYFRPIWNTFWSYSFPNIAVEIDAQAVFEGPALVFVGNISRYALGLEILHNARFDDGLLDVCIYKCRSRMRLVGHSFLTILKQHTKSDDVIYRQGRKITVSSDTRQVQTEIDGDPGPPMPVQIEVIPHAVKVLIPKGGRPAGIRRRLIRILD
ncbi:MAG: diacylglycerol kinase family protein [Planctomycetota bacterium]